MVKLLLAKGLKIKNLVEGRLRGKVKVQGRHLRVVQGHKYYLVLQTMVTKLTLAETTALHHMFTMVTTYDWHIIDLVLSYHYF